MIGLMVFLVLLQLVCGLICRSIAIRMGLDRAFWFAMGIVFGPLALPVMPFIKPGRN